MIQELSKPETQKFIRDHEQHDPFQLVLQAKKYPDLPIKAIVEQIRARQKAKTKLPEWYQTEGIVFPPLLSIEQCSSEATARYKSGLVSGSHLVDLTGGAGVDTYYMSQSFDKVDYVEKNGVLSAIARHNLQVLRANNIAVHHTQSEDFLQTLSRPVNCIYLDPARRDDHALKVFRLEDCTPNVVDMLHVLVSRAQTVLIKTSPMLDIGAAMQELQYVDQVHVVAVNNECKEVLYQLKTEPSQDQEVIAINLQGYDHQVFKFRKSAEITAEVIYSPPLQYVYEPNVAILKAGAFKLIAQAYSLYKLHPHTHLYTSDQLVPDFPGRIFKCEAIRAYNRKAVQGFLPENKANITTRNFPDSVKEARKKLGIAEGGSYYLFLAVVEEKPKVMITTKI